VVEWFMASVLKTDVVERPPWVRIPPSPPFFADFRKRRMPSEARRAKDGLLPFTAQLRMARHL
jgi:hypothetical protein